ncbi:hypothetical protein D3C79_882680 [compost metagenome]
MLKPLHVVRRLLRGMFADKAVQQSTGHAGLMNSALLVCVDLGIAFFLGVELLVDVVVTLSDRDDYGFILTTIILTVLIRQLSSPLELLLQLEADYSQLVLFQSGKHG